MNVHSMASIIDGASTEITHEERALVRQARTLAQLKFAPRAAHYDRTNTFPHENFQDLADAGLLSLLVPKQYGGKGVSQLAYAGVVLELAKADAATALCFTMHATTTIFLNHLATPEQKRRFFGLIVDERIKLSALGSEPNANIFSGKLPGTVATRVPGGGYTLSGRKAWCSLGGNADWAFVNACIDGQVIGVMVRLDAPGVTVHEDWDTMAMRGTQSATIDFREVHVAQEDVIQQPLHLFLELEYAVGLCASYLGLSVATYEVARDLAAGTVQRLLESDVGHGHPDVGRLFSTVGEMRIALEPAWLMLQRAAVTEPIGSYQRSWALAQAKHVIGETCAKIASQSLRVAGAKALSRKFPLERMFRDAQAGLLMAIKPDNAAYLTGRFELGVMPTGLTVSPAPSGYAIPDGLDESAPSLV